MHTSLGAAAWRHRVRAQDESSSRRKKQQQHIRACSSEPISFARLEGSSLQTQVCPSASAVCPSCCASCQGSGPGVQLLTCMALRRKETMPKPSPSFLLWSCRHCALRVCLVSDLSSALSGGHTNHKSNQCYLVGWDFPLFLACERRGSFYLFLPPNRGSCRSRTALSISRCCQQ